MKRKVSCIVAAGGSGTRMGADVNKLLLTLDGIPVIVYTLLALEKSAAVDEIVISTREEDIVKITELVSVFSLSKVKTVVKGGKTRGESVLSAAKEISPDTDFVMIHDGARPCVWDKILTETVKSAQKNGAAACGVKPKCTLKSVNDGFITGTVDREKTIEIQTPQVFKKELFDKMYSQSVDVINSATDDCILAEKSGAKIAITDGSYQNIKITTPEDLKIAQMFIEGE